MKQKWTLLVISLFCCLGMTQAQEKKIVVSSASMLWDMVKEIAGDKVDNQLIVPIGGDPHVHEPTPVDAQKVGAADLIFVNGLTFEGWITELIDNSGTSAKTVIVTEGITPISSSVYENAYDPHAWMDLTLGLKYIENIKNALVEMDPDNKEFYIKNYSTYATKLNKLDKYITDKIQNIPESKRLLVTSHDAFKYYGKRYGLRVEGIMGISTESEAQTKDMLRVVNAIRESGVPAIFIESTINPKLIQQIAKDNNVNIGGKLYADSIGPKGSSGHSYYDMLKHNTDVIHKALTSTNGVDISGERQSANNFLMYGIIGIILLLSLVFMIIKMNRS